MTSLQELAPAGFSDLPSRSKERTGNRDDGKDGDKVRLKVMACTLCRRRKLKCDGRSPSCATCARQGGECVYPEGRKRSGPRRGYVRGLESRLVQLEALLQVQDFGQPDISVEEAMFNDSQFAIPEQQISPETAAFRHAADDVVPNELFDQAFEVPIAHDHTRNLDPMYSWELIDIGLEEPLPLQETIEELTEIYFGKIHPSVPILHRSRYLAAMSLSPRARPSVALRYAVWSLAASITPKYGGLTVHFYARARKYAELAEMSGHGEGCVNVCNTQAWALIGLYEFRMMHFPRAWLSTSRAVRLAQMMGMHKLDTGGWVGKKVISQPGDWVEREERRRTFWFTFCLDRNATVGSGWPVIIEEKDICTNLPCSEESYEQGNETSEMSLTQAMLPTHASKLSPFAGVIVITSLFGRALTHLNEPGSDEDFENLNGSFWRRHRNMDGILLNTSLYLPAHLRLPSLLPTPNTVLLNLNLHAATICLHQAAVLKAKKHDLPSSIVAGSKMRCLAAAAEVVTILRMVAHMDFSMMNSFAPFASFVACRIFVEQVKEHPQDEDARETVQFVLSAIAVMGVFNPLASSFLLQLETELEGFGIAVPQSPDHAGLAVDLADLGTKFAFPWAQVISPLVTVVDHSSLDESSVGPTSSGSPQVPKTTSFSKLETAMDGSSNSSRFETGTFSSRDASETTAERSSVNQRDEVSNISQFTEEVWKLGDGSPNMLEDFIEGLIGEDTIM